MGSLVVQEEGKCFDCWFSLVMPVEQEAWHHDTKSGGASNFLPQVRTQRVITWAVQVLVRVYCTESARLMFFRGVASLPQLQPRGRESLVLVKARFISGAWVSPGLILLGPPLPSFLLLRSSVTVIMPYLL